MATGAVALLAGGDGGVALRLGVAMVALQASIGALNDLVDAPIDAGRKPGKPIPAGLVPPILARAIVVVSAALGLILAASSPGLLLLAAVGLGIGYAYDLVAKGSAWSWLPLALGLPLLPVFGWYGATGTLPTGFALLVPAAVMAGAGLATANAMADLDRDESAQVGSVAIRLGAGRAWVVGAALHAAVGLIALGSLWAVGADAPELAAGVLSIGIVFVGVALGRASSSTILERAWEVQAIGVALLGVTWVWGMAGAG
jgi:4-hydroxybenzoate polyprenyltransferase